MPVDGLGDVAAGIVALRAEATRAGRQFEDFDLNVLAAYTVWPLTPQDI